MTGRRVIPVTGRGYVIGEHHHRATLSDDDVRLILALRAEGVSQQKVADKFECSRRTVRDIEGGLARSSVAEAWREARGGPKRPERKFVMASRWPCRIKPAKPDEFDLIHQSETACAPPQAVSENAS
jgi:DNA-binding XRE family transcriptional regulator